MAVRSEQREGVAIVTLDKPDKLNAFDVPMAAALHDALARAARDDAVGAVVLTGAGRAFCAGGDASAMLAEAEPSKVFAELTAHLHPCSELLATMAKPTVAAVNGVAAGGGFSLALACDLRVAAQEAKFKAAFMTLGAVPDTGITWQLPRVVGPARARELLLLDLPVDASRALELGLVHRVVPSAHLADEALALARQLAQGPRFAQAKTKALLDGAFGRGLNEHLDDERRWNTESARLPDLREGLRAFAEKRKPRFGQAR
jgi:2-(1,2-epoxy-1,2-dihydrophenyl)acetyl-CoA isomerase